LERMASARAMSVMGGALCRPARRLWRILADEQLIRLTCNPHLKAFSEDFGVLKEAVESPLPWLRELLLKLRISGPLLRDEDNDIGPGPICWLVCIDDRLLSFGTTLRPSPRSK